MIINRDKYLNQIIQKKRSFFLKYSGRIINNEVESTQSKLRYKGA